MKAIDKDFSTKENLKICAVKNRAEREVTAEKIDIHRVYPSSTQNLTSSSYVVYVELNNHTSLNLSYFTDSLMVNNVHALLLGFDNPLVI